MARVWIYVLNSSKDPYSVGCVVPWMVDEELIYFGPCKRRLRERLRKEYLTDGCTHSAVSDDLYIVSVNGSNAKRMRIVVAAGKLSEVMTFAEAATRAAERDPVGSAYLVRSLPPGGRN